MMKRLIIVAIATATLAGCANTSTLSGDVYSANQAKQVQQVTYGTIVSMEPVQIQAGNEANVIGTIGGAVIGGLLGNTIGGGTGRSLATAAGAVAGGVAGNSIEGAVNRTNGVQLVIRLDSGKTIAVVQKNDKQAFRVNQRVMLLSNGSTVNVSPM
ncbi:MULTISPECIES: glycine zipper 2TM domain-containing protein [Edwardsiella]|uniref:Outer membrane lipoprotein n=2 Tax=Edwardsiella anguillarum TaxID=1821960 RepID=A0A076LTX5_9GAMM|nr:MULTISPECIES: glycine zipper 2TM domain-containing protein [Edwardsiella]AKM47910.1 membrane protein [Edwardsiella sp. EA181011]GAJ68830.1 outer membrane lipoprotein pcp [Edwardsiella piscicida]AIJ10142.1 outer membrane lipoprotein [Edwardsiella anguillarum ET080813]AKR77723.1 glycine zipper 2TM domain-containing protein [Edwardsiella sp. LADL05-105]KAB0592172.1 glycine zipper 2TM domain-containing protein [Edwardsiella anguillarum]